MVQPASAARPNEPVAPGAEPHNRARANGFRRPSLRSQENARHGATQRRAQHLVQHHAAAAVVVLDGEQAAVGKGGDLQPRRIFDPRQAKLAFARRAETAKALLAHSLPSKAMMTPPLLFKFPVGVVPA